MIAAFIQMIEKEEQFEAKVESESLEYITEIRWYMVRGFWLSMKMDPIP